MSQWKTIPIYENYSPAAKKQALRLNALGSLFYFGKAILGHNRFSNNLHAYMCRQLEQDSLRLALEIPRDHFKTSVASVSAPMWWALPFNDDDEEAMRSIGYDDAWIRWMRRAHNPNTRTLIASEVLGNARKIGAKIAGHYESNSMFRFLFPEILPKKTDKWNQDSMTHNRLPGEYHGEGTYDFIGAKGALQSRHYVRQIIDDIVGEKAINSDLVMESTIDWIRKLPGAFDSDPSDPTRMADQLFIGNRWSQRDVGAWLRKNVSGMKFETHSAEGGCCELHPAGLPIFPEEFSIEKLHEIKKIEGSYNYSAHFLNNPVDPDAVRFRSSWLKWFSINPWNDPESNAAYDNPKYVANSQQWGQTSGYNQQLVRSALAAENSGAVPTRLKAAIHHETQAGEVLDDIRAGVLERVAILDPNHSQEAGRSRHAIAILGYYNMQKQPRRIYLLDAWAKACSFEEMIDRLIGTRPDNPGLAFKWRVHHIYLESEVAGQQGWKFYFKEKIQQMGPMASFTIRPLKTDRSANAKQKRIIGMEPIYENGLFYVRRQGCEVFTQEYETFPNGQTMDVLDVVGYAPQTWEPGSRQNTRDFVKQELNRRQQMIQNMGQAGY